MKSLIFSIRFFSMKTFYLDKWSYLFISIQFFNLFCKVLRQTKMISRIFSLNSEPTNEEIQASPYFIKVRNSFSAFQQNQQFEDTKIKYFQSFLDDFTHFIFHETNKKLIEFISIDMIQSAMEFSTLIEFDKNRIMLIFNILEKILLTTNFQKSKEVNEFILSLAATKNEINSKDGIQLLKNNENILKKVFSGNSFFSDYASNRYFIKFFEICFCDVHSLELCSLFRSLICENSPIEVRSKLDIQELLNYLTKPINHELHVELIQILIKLVSSNEKFRFYFNDNHQFTSLTDLFPDNYSFIENCFNDLIFSPPNDFIILRNIILFYQKHPKYQDQIFHWIFEIIQEHEEFIDDIEKVIPLSNWVTHNTSINTLLDTMNIIAQIKSEIVPQFLSPLFALLCKGESELSQYLSSLQVIERQIVLHQVSLSYLLESLFLQTFVINTPLDILGNLFSESYTFAQLVYDIFALKSAEALRSDVLNKLIQMAAKFPNNAHFLSIFLVVSDSHQNVADIMKIILNEQKGELCISLGSSFPKSDIIIQYFLQENGIEWLDQVFKKNIIDIMQFRFMINALTMRYLIKDADDYILSLPKDHLLFCLSKPSLKVLAYGYENAHSFYPLKLPSIFPLIDCPDSIDPYNAYLIGKRVLHTFENPLELKIINQVANRYLSDEIFKKILYSATPAQMENFCDLSIDHFPIFQVFEFSEDHVFDLSFTSLSFWFKFGPTLLTEFKVPFFHVDKLHLYTRNLSVIANYEGVEYETPIDPFKWNHVFISVSAQRASHQIKIRINTHKAIFHSATSVEKLSNFEFTGYSSYLFLGSAIRIYEDNKCKEIDTIYQSGPSFITPLHESIIITPYSTDKIKKGKNLLPVKYKGFPSHFLAKRKLNLLLERMENEPKDDKEFESMISLCYKIYSIMKNALPDFFRLILTVYTKVPNFVTLKLFKNTLSFFTKHKKKEEVIDTIIGHRELWDKIPNEIIIGAILTYFDDFSFYDKFDKLEQFFVSRAFYNQESTFLIEIILHSLKRSWRLIDAFFVSSHFLENNENPCEDTKEFDQEIKVEKNGKIEVLKKVKNTVFQKTIANSLKNLIVTTKIVDFLPIDDLMSLFILSQQDMRSLLFSIFMEIEMAAPNTIFLDDVFLSLISPLFVNESVWNEMFCLLTDDGKNISKPSLILPLLSLVWGLTAASLQSMLTHGKPLTLSANMSKIINFLSYNSKNLSNNPAVHKFIITWYPFVLGCSSPSSSSSSSLISEDLILIPAIKMENTSLTPPNPIQFMSNIWETVIKNAKLPLTSEKEIDVQLFTNFMFQSEIFNLYANYILSISNNHALEILESFLAVPIFSKNSSYAKLYAGNFIRLLLNNAAEGFNQEMQIIGLLSTIHYNSAFGYLNSSTLTTIISDVFVLASVIKAIDPTIFQTNLNTINLLLLDLLLKIDQENLSILYKILLQHLIILSNIISLTNSVELYLDFFLQTYSDCIQTFDNFFPKFLTALQLKQSDFKQIELLLNHKTLEVKNYYQNLPNYLTQTRLIVKQINDICIANMHSSLTDLKEYSRIFSISYVVAYQRQKQFSSTLKSILIAANNFWCSKMVWEKIVNDYQNSKLLEKYPESYSENDSFNKNESESEYLRYQIAPFSLPLRIPKIYVKTVFNSNKEAEMFINNMNLYKLPLNLTSFQQLNLQNYAYCTILRYANEFKSIICYSKAENSIVFIPFCLFECDNKPLTPNIEMIQFVKDVVNGMWGSSSVKLFERRILLKIPIDSILFLKEIKENEYCIWSIVSGYFIVKDLEKGNILSYFGTLNYSNVIKFESDIQKVCNNYEKAKISDYEFLMNLNIQKGKVISEIQNFPILPKPFIDSKNNLIAALTEVVSENSHLPLSLEDDEISEFVKTQFQVEIQNVNKQPKLEVNNYKSHKISELCSNKCKLDINPSTNQILPNLPKYSIRIFSNHQSTFYIVANRSRMSLSLMSISNNTQNDNDKNQAYDLKKVYEEKSPVFGRITQLNGSQNGLFFSIDFNYEISYAYRIVYNKNIPICFRFVRDISFDLGVKTSISGVDWMAVSQSGKKLFFWHLFRNTVHKILVFQNLINLIRIDDNFGIVWLILQNNKNENGNEIETVRILSLNGEELGASNILNDKKVTALSVVNLPSHFTNRLAICGFDDGSLCFLSLNVKTYEMTILPLNSMHTRKITNISINELGNTFISCDQRGTSYLWSYEK
ncbi:hypothetical protein TRFO_08959 [Tritrichomonas foetus]|uniref:Uncharacterized protein n=1 Tax=Tritrichomonas foetus TaxID=1144522 RepID=A0A1J4JM72_9EUKA|nr:hypothetical protein TRFO_08959 [Tritrichomonas foetus]|eukprot:OHS98364.1 hypothetical protein TRFO_08959 [Tritrichomonas foetus]